MFPLYARFFDGTAGGNRPFNIHGADPGFRRRRGQWFVCLLNNCFRISLDAVVFSLYNTFSDVAWTCPIGGCRRFWTYQATPRWGQVHIFYLLRLLLRRNGRRQQPRLVILSRLRRSGPVLYVLRDPLFERLVSLDKVKECWYCVFSGDIPGCVRRILRPHFLNEGVSVDYFIMDMLHISLINSKPSIIAPRFVP